MGESNMSVFDEIIETISKEVIDEKDNITQNLLAIFSTYSHNPLNLRNLSPSGYGKTHMVESTVQYFPPDDIIKLARATPQSFKYHGKKMVEIMPDTFIDYQKAMDDLIEKFPNEEERTKERKWIDENIWTVFDFENKTLIFLDSQSFGLWESIKPVLSHDTKVMKSLGVNKGKSGTLQGERFATLGAPSVIYCSAKNEIERDTTNEMNTRFITISIKSNSTKNKKRHQMTAMKYGLPDKLFQQKSNLTDEEKELTKSKIKMLIDEVKYNETVNVYAMSIGEKLNNDSPNDRELKNLLTNINILTCVHSSNRFVLVNHDDAFLLSSFSDIKHGMELTKKPESLPIAKIEFFNKKVKPLLFGKIGGLKSIEIAEELGFIKKHLWENYLKPFVDCGYLVENGDRYSGYLLFLAPQYENKDATEESPLIDTSILDISCVKSELEWWIEKGYHLELYDGNPTSVESFLENNGESTTELPEIMPTITGDDVAKPVEENIDEN